MKIYFNNNKIMRIKTMKKKQKSMNRLKTYIL